MNLYQYHREIRDSDLKTAHRTVLYTLSTWGCGEPTIEQGRTGWRVWPEMDELARACAYTPKTLRAHLKSMPEVWLKRAPFKYKGRMRINFYLSCPSLMQVSDACSVEETTLVKSSTENMVTGKIYQGTPGDFTRGTLVKSSLPYIGSKETIKETKKENRAKQGASAQESPNTKMACSASSFDFISGTGTQDKASAEQEHRTAVIQQWVKLFDTDCPAALLTLPHDRAWLCLAWMSHKAARTPLGSPSKILARVVIDISKGLKTPFAGFVRGDVLAMTSDYGPEEHGAIKGASKSRGVRVQPGRVKQEEKKQGAKVGSDKVLSGEKKARYLAELRTMIEAREQAEVERKEAQVTRARERARRRMEVV